MGDVVSLAAARKARADQRFNSWMADRIEEGERIASERLARLLDGEDFPPGGHAA